MMQRAATPPDFIRQLLYYPYVFILKHQESIMTLTLHLSPEIEARLQTAAQAQGLTPVALAEQLLAISLPLHTVEASAAGGEVAVRAPELVATVKRIRGKFARGTEESGTEALHRERQTDKVGEEHAVRGTPA
jgi:pseudouridine-5'-phosphate glycosidase